MLEDSLVVELVDTQAVRVLLGGTLPGLMQVDNPLVLEGNQVLAQVGSHHPLGRLGNLHRGREGNHPPLEPMVGNLHHLVLVGNHLLVLVGNQHLLGQAGTQHPLGQVGNPLKQVGNRLVVGDSCLLLRNNSLLTPFSFTLKKIFESEQLILGGTNH